MRRREVAELPLHEAIRVPITRTVGGLFREFLRPSDGMISVSADTLRTWANRAERLEQAATKELLEENDRLRKALGQSWSHYLELVMTTTTDDGTPVIDEVFRQNPDLVQRLKRAILR